jgi:hypothetical protein
VLVGFVWRGHSSLSWWLSIPRSHPKKLRAAVPSLDSFGGDICRCIAFSFQRSALSLGPPGLKICSEGVSLRVLGIISVVSR